MLLNAFLNKYLHNFMRQYIPTATPKPTAKPKRNCVFSNGVFIPYPSGMLSGVIVSDTTPVHGSQADYELHGYDPPDTY